MVSRAWNSCQTSGSAIQCHDGGRQPATTPRQDRFIVVQATRHPFVNPTTLRNELRNAVGVNISTQTVRNRLRQSGLRSRGTCIHIPLTRLHKQARLNWVQDHVNWTDNYWDPVLFTDESRYCIDFTYRRARVWRRRGERFIDANISKVDHYGGVSIMVWAGISRGGRTDLHIVMRGMMRCVRYMDEILDVYVRSYTGAIKTSSSSWTTTLDFIVPGWLRSTPTGDHRPHGQASMLPWSQPDRACLEHATCSDFASSGPATNSLGTGKGPH